MRRKTARTRRAGHGGLAASADVGSGAAGGPPSGVASDQPRRRIQHLVVIFQENISFDHYFGTYPFATNPHGEPRFPACQAGHA